MGSPQYGELVLDGEPIAKGVERDSLTWSDDRRFLAVQQFVSGADGPRTRIVVFDAEQRVELVVTETVAGICNPVRFEDNSLLYSHWHHRRGERELDVSMPA